MQESFKVFGYFGLLILVVLCIFTAQCSCIGILVWKVRAHAAVTVKQNNPVVVSNASSSDNLEVVYISAYGKKAHFSARCTTLRNSRPGTLKVFEWCSQCATDVVHRRSDK